MRRADKFASLLLSNPSLPNQVRHLNIFSIFSKEAREKERARLADELNRGYFDDFKDLKKTGGKVGLASPSLAPGVGAKHFPKLTTFDTTGSREEFPTADHGSKQASLVCLAFRAGAQGMISSWTERFIASFETTKDVELVQVSLVESWFLSLSPVRAMLLRSMRSKSQSLETELARRTLYSFGDTYYLRKELGIPNILVGYVYLLDKKGRVRWRGSGFATQEELTAMVNCVSKLLEEQHPGGLLHTEQEVV